MGWDFESMSSGGQIITFGTRIQILGVIPPLTNISLIVSTPHTLVSGDSFYIGETSDDFLYNNSLKVYINGILQSKHTQVIYVDNHTIQIDRQLDIGEEILVYG